MRISDTRCQLVTQTTVIVEHTGLQEFNEKGAIVSEASFEVVSTNNVNS
jgi:hypothetical protein